ncbi:hypothetical protein EAH79_11240 [Sphingomonas koreensis]|nr:hypothetical protein EAH79_11240 [Sphingomonas koreensis]
MSPPSSPRCAPPNRVLAPAEPRYAARQGHAAPAKEPAMAKSQKKSNKEVRKPKAEKVKTNAANPSTKNKAVEMTTLKS